MSALGRLREDSMLRGCRLESVAEGGTGAAGAGGGQARCHVLGRAQTIRRNVESGAADIRSCGSYRPDTGEEERRESPPTPGA